MTSPLPIIDLRPIHAGDTRAVAAQIAAACRDTGFFYVTGHGVDEALIARITALGRQFFAQGPEAKMRIAMARGGRAWRG